MWVSGKWMPQNSDGEEWKVWWWEDERTYKTKQIKLNDDFLFSRHTVSVCLELQTLLSHPYPGKHGSTQDFANFASFGVLALMYFQCVQVLGTVL